MNKIDFLYEKINMRCVKLFLCLEYIFSTVIETILLSYFTNIYLKTIGFVDILGSLLFPFHYSIFYILQIINCGVFIGLLCISSFRMYSLFWIYFIFKNSLRFFLIKKDHVPKKDLLLDDLEETSTVLSV